MNFGLEEGGSLKSTAFVFAFVHVPEYFSGEMRCREATERGNSYSIFVFLEVFENMKALLAKSKSVKESEFLHNISLSSPCLPELLISPGRASPA